MWGENLTHPPHPHPKWYDMIYLLTAIRLSPGGISTVELVRNLMAHAQKPDFVFRLNGRVHLNRRGSQFSRLLAAEMCASTLVMLDTPRSEVVWEYWLPIPFASFPSRVSPHSERSIHIYTQTIYTTIQNKQYNGYFFKNHLVTFSQFSSLQFQWISSLKTKHRHNFLRTVL